MCFCSLTCPPVSTRERPPEDCFSFFFFWSISYVVEMDPVHLYYTSIRIYRCDFYITQIWYRQLQQILGNCQVYRIDRSRLRLLVALAGLPNVSPVNVLPAWNAAFRSFSIMYLGPPSGYLHCFPPPTSYAGM